MRLHNKLSCFWDDLSTAEDETLSISWYHREAWAIQIKMLTEMDGHSKVIWGRTPLCLIEKLQKGHVTFLMHSKRPANTFRSELLGFNLTMLVFFFKSVWIEKTRCRDSTETQQQVILKRFNWKSTQKSRKFVKTCKLHDLLFKQSTARSSEHRGKKRTYNKWIYGVGWSFSHLSCWSNMAPSWHFGFFRQINFWRCFHHSPSPVRQSITLIISCISATAKGSKNRSMTLSKKWEDSSRTGPSEGAVVTCSQSWHPELWWRFNTWLSIHDRVMSLSQTQLSF